MKIKPFRFIVYLVYLFVITEIFANLATPYLKERILFTSSFNPPSSWKPKYFDPDLGWVSENRLNYGGDLDCFGDSFTYGDEVNEDETWPYLLNENTIRTSNYGVKAYGSDQIFLRAKKNIKNRSKILLFVFITESIRRNMTIYRPFYSPVDKGKHFYTKPKFYLKNGAVKFFPNINRQVEDRQNIRSQSFLKKFTITNTIRSFQQHLMIPFPKLNFFFRKLFGTNFTELLLKMRRSKVSILMKIYG